MVFKIEQLQVEFRWVLAFHLDTLYDSVIYYHTNYGCRNHSNLEIEAECLTKTFSYLNLNISRTKNGRNKL